MNALSGSRSAKKEAGGHVEAFENAGDLSDDLIDEPIALIFEE